jgi:hypothetical protein
MNRRANVTCDVMPPLTQTSDLRSIRSVSLSVGRTSGVGWSVDGLGLGWRGGGGGRGLGVSGLHNTPQDGRAQILTPTISRVPQSNNLTSPLLGGLWGRSGNTPAGAGRQATSKSDASSNGVVAIGPRPLYLNTCSVKHTSDEHEDKPLLTWGCHYNTTSRSALTEL